MMVVRRSRRNNVLIITAVLLIILALARSDYHSRWEKVKEVFKDDPYNSYRQIKANNIDKAKADSSLVDLDLKDIFKSAEGQSERSGINFTPRYEKQNATFYSFVKTNQIMELLASIQSVENRFNKNFHYDWVFVSNKKINTVSRKLLSHSVSGNSIFYTLPKQQWGFPQGVDKNRASKARRKSRLNHITTGIADLLRFRSRFHAGFFPTAVPMLRYKYYMRVDPGIELQCDRDQDFFAQIAQEGKKMAFVAARKDASKAVETLWSQVDVFMKENPKLIAKDNLMKFFIDDKTGEVNNCFLSNSLEIMDLDFLRSEAYNKLFTHLDSQHGWFYERWTDYHIHSLAALLFLPKRDIAFINLSHLNIEYRTCAVHEEQYLTQNCYCQINKDEFFADEHKSCMERLIQLLPADSALQDLKQIRAEKAQQQALMDEDFRKAELVEEEEGSLYNKGEDAKSLQDGNTDDESDGDADAESGSGDQDAGNANEE